MIKTGAKLIHNSYLDGLRRVKAIDSIDTALSGSDFLKSSPTLDHSAFGKCNSILSTQLNILDTFPLGLIVRFFAILP